MPKWRSRAPATRVDQPWRSGSRGGLERGIPRSLSASPITVATPNQQLSLHSTAVLSSRASVFSRVPSRAPAAGISSPDQAPSRRGHRHSRLDQSAKSRLNPAQITGLAGPNSLGFGGGFHREEHHLGSGDGWLHGSGPPRHRGRVRRRAGGRDQALGGTPPGATKRRCLPRGLGRCRKWLSELVGASRTAAQFRLLAL